jgi:hypothetical protein
VAQKIRKWLAVDISLHQLHNLLNQFGLLSDANGIARFIAAHAPLAGHINLPDRLGQALRVV